MIKNKVKANFKIAKLFTIIFAILFVVSLYMSINAFASENPFKINSATIEDKSIDAKGSITSFNDYEVINNATFYKLNDYVVYKLVIQSNINKEITILSIADDNENEYIEYEYDKHENEKLNAEGKFEILLKAIYKNELTDITRRRQSNDVIFTIKYLEEDEEKTSTITVNSTNTNDPTTIINPTTGDNVHLSYILLFVSSVGLIGCIVLQKKKISKVSVFIITFMILSPMVVKALTYSYNITLKSSIEINDKVVVTIIDEDVTREEIINYNSKITLEDGEKEGYEFNGWKLEDDTYFDVSSNITKDIVLTADYSREKVNILLNANGGSVVQDHVLKELESEIGQLPTPTPPTGKKFEGWYTQLENGEKVESSYIVTSSKTLYAMYSDLELTVSFDTNEGSIVLDQIITYGNKAQRPAIDPEKEQHVFIDWYTDETYETLFDFDNEITTDTTIYANYYHICRTFATDSWDTIRDNLEEDPSYYAIGCEKKVEMDMDDDNEFESYRLRLANTSTPEVCSVEGYSQTACGLVLEFADIVTTHRMNPTQTNAGGWKNTEMITWLNSDFYDKLPNDLKSVIIPTFPIVSGAGEDTTSPDVESDDMDINKIYLLSVREAGFNFTVIDSKSDVDTDTRTLDYYVSHDMVQTTKYDLDNLNSHWWLRTADNDSYGLFAYVFGMDSSIIRAGYGSNYAQSSLGVAPAFRIGTLHNPTVTFNTGGATSVASQTVGYGEKATRPSVIPEKDGFEFVNWYTDQSFTTVFDFENKKVTKDITLYARFVTMEYCRHFSTDSWDNIVSNLENNPNYYPLGCEREIPLDMDYNGEEEFYTIRIANTSTPEVCNTDGYSQTACGFVLEFTDIVSFEPMNSTDTNIGGWKSSDLALWLNTEFYGKLPRDLQSVIIPTYPIVSGSGEDTESPDITSADTDLNKIYLLSTKEVGIDDDYDNKNNENTDTRVLDSYAEHYNYNGYYDRIKYDITGHSNYWWLRSALFDGDMEFFEVEYSYSESSSMYASEPNGVAPAFRIGVN